MPVKYSARTGVPPSSRAASMSLRSFASQHSWNGDTHQSVSSAPKMRPSLRCPDPVALDERGEGCLGDEVGRVRRVTCADRFKLAGLDEFEVLVFPDAEPAPNLSSFQHSHAPQKWPGLAW